MRGIKFSNVLFSLLIVLFTQNHVFSQSSELIATHIIYRHGDRTPISLYPTSKDDSSSWPNGLGQLTARGQLQHVRLGQYLRRRYSSLLNSTYVASEITVRSTDYDRTLMSAYSNLLGLYPTSQEELERMLEKLSENSEWPIDVPWQPIPVHTVPAATDYLLSNGNCPRFYELFEQLANEEVIQNLTRVHQDLFQQLQQNTGTSVQSIFDAWLLADTIIIESLYNRAPAWVTPSVVAELQQITDLSFTQLFSHSEVGRLLGGSLVREIMQNVQGIIAQKMTARKAKIYSAHDITLAAVLSFFGVKTLWQPPYASMLSFDLYRLSDNNYGIQLAYHRSPNHPVEFIRLPPPCSTTVCSVQTLNSWLADQLPDLDMTQACQRRRPELTGFHRSSGKDYRKLIMDR